jgi:hypothetical protein
MPPNGGLLRESARWPVERVLAGQKRVAGRSNCKGSPHRLQPLHRWDAVVDGWGRSGCAGEGGDNVGQEGVLALVVLVGSGGEVGVPGQGVGHLVEGRREVVDLEGRVAAPGDLGDVVDLEALVVAHDLDALARRAAALDRAHGDGADGAAREVEGDVEEDAPGGLLDLAGGQAGAGATSLQGAAVAVANKLARIAWALMVRGGIYREAAVR